LKLDSFADKVEIIKISTGNRPAGPRFGTLVHAVLAAIPLDATPEGIRLSAELQGRIFGATSQEVDAAITTITNALQHPLMKRARVALASGRCHREMPLILKDVEGMLVEGIADLVFQENHLWFVVDFKTDQELASELGRYRRQVGIYAATIAKVTGSSTAAFLLRV
jgi:ATP-dependent exoDNAse (exonuclease V) beta subunit